MYFRLFCSAERAHLRWSTIHSIYRKVWQIYGLSQYNPYISSEISLYRGLYRDRSDKMHQDIVIIQDYLFFQFFIRITVRYQVPQYVSVCSVIIK